MRVIGLTGGIASGKSTVANLFAQHNVPIIDSDHIVHHLMQPGSDNVKKISEKFGTAYLVSSGELNRKKLRSHIFEDPSAKQWLENLLHPQIHHAIMQQLKKIKAPYVIIVIPLLIETQTTLSYPMLDRILVVDCSPTLQKQRLLARDHIATSLIDRMLAQQASRQQRLAIADDVIDNQTDMAQLKTRVAALHTYYLTLAQADL